MKKCHGGLETIVAIVLMVLLVVLLLATSVVGLSHDAGNIMHHAVDTVADVQNSQISGTGGTVIKINSDGTRAR